MLGVNVQSGKFELKWMCNMCQECSVRTTGVALLVTLIICAQFPFKEFWVTKSAGTFTCVASGKAL